MSEHEASIWTPGEDADIVVRLRAGAEPPIYEAARTIVDLRAGAARLIAEKWALCAAGDRMADGIAVIGLVSCSSDCDHSLCVLSRAVEAWRALRALGEQP